MPDVALVELPPKKPKNQLSDAFVPRNRQRECRVYGKQTIEVVNGYVDSRMTEKQKNSPYLACPER